MPKISLLLPIVVLFLLGCGLILPTPTQIIATQTPSITPTTTPRPTITSPPKPTYTRQPTRTRTPTVTPTATPYAGPTVRLANGQMVTFNSACHDDQAYLVTLPKKGKFVEECRYSENAGYTEFVINYDKEQLTDHGGDWETLSGGLIYRTYLEPGKYILSGWCDDYCELWLTTTKGDQVENADFLFPDEKEVVIDITNPAGEWIWLSLEYKDFGGGAGFTVSLAWIKPLEIDE